MSSFDLDRYLDEHYRRGHDDSAPEPRRTPRDAHPDQWSPK
jgi:hypothetical protein